MTVLCCVGNHLIQIKVNIITDEANSANKDQIETEGEEDEDIPEVDSPKSPNKQA